MTSHPSSDHRVTGGLDGDINDDLAGAIVTTVVSTTPPQHVADLLDAFQEIMHECVPVDVAQREPLDDHISGIRDILKEL